MNTKIHRYFVPNNEFELQAIVEGKIIFGLDLLQEPRERLGRASAKGSRGERRTAAPLSDKTGRTPAKGAVGGGGKADKGGNVTARSGRGRIKPPQNLLGSISVIDRSKSTFREKDEIS
jgi:hypothetical protein